MGTIVSSMSNLYFDLYVGDVFSVEKAVRVMHNCNDVDRRVSYIKAVYDTVFDSSIINETSKILIRSRKSYAEVARYYNCLHEQDIKRTKEAEDIEEKISNPVHPKTAALVKADVCYTNKKLKSVLGCDSSYGSESNFFNIVLWSPEIDGNLWLQADLALEKLKVMCNGSLLGKEAFWLNIPVREFNKELTEQEFNHLVELIKPYFNSQKAIAQLELNKRKREAGYLNYILRADMELNEVDCARRDFILGLADKSLVRKYKESADPECNVYNSEIAVYQNKLLRLKEIHDVEKKKRSEIMSKIGFIHYTNKTGVLPESQMAQLEDFEKEYESLKEAEEKRLRDMRLLEEKIEKRIAQQKIIEGMKDNVDDEYLDF